MEYRIKDYTIKGQRILLPRQTSIEDLRLIFNETQKKLICSTATKDNVTLVQGEGGTLVEVPTSVCSLNSTDLLTIKCDYGDSLEEVKEAVENIDLSSVENKVEEVKQAVENIDLTPIENKVQEGVNTLSSKIDNIDLSAVENKVQEESAAIQAKIDNIKLPEIDTTELAKEATLNAVSNKLDNIKLPEIDTSAIAKQGENQDATNTAIYALLSQFGESVLQEKVTVILNCQESIAWQDYVVNVTFEDGRIQAVPLSDNGTCSFSIKIGQNYSVQLPVIGTFIAPELKSYTAISSAREIYWSYVAMGVFGMDELGRRYSIEQIEALEDKSIIKYGGFTDEYLENCNKEDGTYGCGFMWKIGAEKYSGSDKRWSYPAVEFSQELLPFLTSDEMAITYCDGESYTRYMISESARLGAASVATFCKEQSITIGGDIKNGFLPAYGQLRRLVLNISFYDRLYNALGATIPDIDSSGMNWWTSCQASATKAVYLRSGTFTMSIAKDNPGAYTFLAFPLS